jgi:hypothetical protein
MPLTLSPSPSPSGKLGPVHTRMPLSGLLRGIFYWAHVGFPHGRAPPELVGGAALAPSRHPMGARYDSSAYDAQRRLSEGGQDGRVMGVRFAGPDDRLHVWHCSSQGCGTYLRYPVADEWDDGDDCTSRNRRLRKSKLRPIDAPSAACRSRTWCAWTGGLER